MDVNLLRSAVTLASLLLFVALTVAVWMPRRKAGFDEAAALPFTGETGAEAPDADAALGADTPRN